MNSAGSVHGSHHGAYEEVLHVEGEMPAAVRTNLEATNRHFTRRCNALQESIDNMRVELVERIDRVENHINVQFIEQRQANDIRFAAITDSLQRLE